jgi:hypothetical protein
VGQKNHLQDLSVDDYNIKKNFYEAGREEMDWIDVANNGKKWRTLVYSVMNLRLH